MEFRFVPFDQLLVYSFRFSHPQAYEKIVDLCPVIQMIGNLKEKDTTPRLGQAVVQEIVPKTAETSLTTESPP